MIGKKINQLATELAPESTDLTIIGDPTTGVSKKITIAQLGAIFSGAVSFYNDLASFPATGDINVIYCAKDTKKLYLWTGSAYVEVFPSQALLDTYQLRSEKGNANGYASLDSQGKVPISQLPSSIMEYKGTWNASTNTPTLANGTGDTGDVYICNVAGTVNFGAGPITFAVGDYVIYSGSIWQRSSGAVGTVTSVAASITGDSVTISGSPVTTSGTLAFAFAGTGAQYIKGDGTLATFPTTIEQAKNLITEVYNSTGVTLTKGTVVYINGGQGNLPTVTKALATGDSTSAQTFGIVQSDITNNNNGFVVIAGKLSDIDTQAYSVGTQLYLSSTTAGAYTSTKQYAPNHLVYIGIIVRSHPTQGIIEVKIQNGYELDELHNVAAQTPTNNDGLFYESSTSLWKNKSIATVLGYTPANAATYVPYTGATANLDLGAFDLISRSSYIEGTASYQAGLLIKQRGLYNFVTGAYTQIVADSATDLNIVHNQANTTRRRYALSVAALQDGDSFQYLLPRANGTFALTSDLTGGTVTSVAALTIGTSGTDLSSTVANGTTTPVITLNVPTASATNRGALSSADWTTFNNKQNALTNPVTGTGTTNYLPKFTGTSTIGNSLVFDDGTNVGISTNNPAYKLDINGSARVNNTLYLVGSSVNNSISANAGMILNSDGSTSSDRNFQFQIAGSPKMLLDASGNVAIGATNPNTLLSLVGNHAGGQSILKIQSSTAYSSSGLSSIGFNDSDGSRKSIIYTNTNGLQLETNTATPIIFNPNGTTALTLANGGAAIFSSNVGLGVTPSAWGSAYRVAMQLGGGGSVAGAAGVGGNSPTYVAIGGNYYLNSSAQDIYIASVAASKYVQNAGEHSWYTAPSGTAGNAISFTQAMTLDASGRLAVGTSSFPNQNSGSLAGTAIFNGIVRISGSSVRYFTSGNGLELSVGSIYSYNRDTASYNDLSINDAMLVKGGGNVGIGTTSPGEKLTVNGTIGLQNSGTQNWGIYTTSTNNIVFQRSGIADRMVITSDGYVGIGTTSPSVALEVSGASNLASRIRAAKTSSGTIEIGADRDTFSSPYISAITNSNLDFFTNDTHRLRITSGGNVGIGTTSPGSYALATEYGGSAAAVISIKNSSASGYSGAHLLNNSGSLMGHFGYANASTAGLTDKVYFGSIASKDVVFTTNDTERMRITSGGTLLVGTTSTTGLTTGSSVNVGISLGGGVISSQVNNNSNQYWSKASGYTSGDFTAHFVNGTYVGGISTNGSSTTYATASDYRLKNDFKDFNGLDLVNKIKTYDYEYKSDKSRSYGVIAHELQSVINYAVTGVKDGKEMQGVDYSKIVPVLIKAIQEQQVQIEQLKNK